MKINVHIREESFSINCGSGGQKIRWLADVAIHRYNHFYGVDIGIAKGVRYENETMLNMDDIICESLSEDAHVWVMLKEDMILLEAEEEEKKK